VSRRDYLQPFAQASAEALAVFDSTSEDNAIIYVRVGEILRSQGFHTEASMLFDAAYQIDRGSRDYLLAKLLEQFAAGIEMLEADLAALEHLDAGFHRFLLTEIFRKAHPDDHAGILTTAGNCHEAFMTGSPADWTCLPNFRLLPTSAHGTLLHGVVVSYREDARDWRVFERDNANR